MTFWINLNWTGSPVPMSKTSSLPGVYSEMVPVLSNSEPVVTLEVCACATPISRAAAQMAPRIDLLQLYIFIIFDFFGNKFSFLPKDQRKHFYDKGPTRFFFIPTYNPNSNDFHL